VRYEPHQRCYLITARFALLTSTLRYIFIATGKIQSLTQRRKGAKKIKVVLSNIRCKSRLLLAQRNATGKMQKIDAKAQRRRGAKNIKAVLNNICNKSRLLLAQRNATGKMQKFDAKAQIKINFFKMLRVLRAFASKNVNDFIHVLFF